MRLLHTSKLQLQEFVGDSIPEYAILSHTWGEDEVLFRHLEDGNAESRRGYEKVKNCCKQAAWDGWDWVWIDTVCIDKSSSAELSEAINSMYMWYGKARICYVYLVDVSATERNLYQLENELVQSRWFTRGWTLQELLAPSQVYFYNDQWKEIGTKRSLTKAIELAAGITWEDMLAPQWASAARKMFWASSRATTRKEDSAYCLLGLFGVNMPLLYGEGNKAFTRLQVEILRTSTDESILAWGNYVHDPCRQYFDGNVTGALASKPSVFRNSSRFVSCDIPQADRKISPPHSMTNMGLRMELFLRYNESLGYSEGLINCKNIETAEWLVLILQDGYDVYFKKGINVLSLNDVETSVEKGMTLPGSEESFRLRTICIAAGPSAHEIPRGIQGQLVDQVIVTFPRHLGMPRSKLFNMDEKYCQTKILSPSLVSGPSDEIFAIECDTQKNDSWSCEWVIQHLSSTRLTSERVAVFLSLFANGVGIAIICLEPKARISEESILSQTQTPILDRCMTELQNGDLMTASLKRLVGNASNSKAGRLRLDIRLETAKGYRKPATAGNKPTRLCVQ